LGNLLVYTDENGVLHIKEVDPSKPSAVIIEGNVQAIIKKESEQSR
jgi:hypothetical protein